MPIRTVPERGLVYDRSVPGRHIALERIAALVPVRGLEGAKSRLGEALDAEERRALVARLLARTISAAAATKLLNAFICASPRYLPLGAGLSQPIRAATAFSTPRFLGCFAMNLRRNSSGSWPAASASSSMKHSMKMQFWLMLTPRQNPGGTCVLRMAWSISRFGMV